MTSSTIHHSIASKVGHAWGEPTAYS
jgi:hypothetical protein